MGVPLNRFEQSMFVAGDRPTTGAALEITRTGPDTMIATGTVTVIARGVSVLSSPPTSFHKQALRNHSKQHLVHCLELNVGVYSECIF